jgi:hypothetical protein
MRDRVILGDDVKLRTLQPPPRAGDRAVGQKAVIEHVVILEPFCPTPVKIIRILRRQNARPRLDLGRSAAARIVEFARLFVHVVFQAFAINFFATGEVLEMDVSSSLDFRRVAVVIHFIRFELHVAGVDDHIAAQVGPGTIRLLLFGVDAQIALGRSIGAGRRRPAIRISTRLRLRGRRR